MATKRTLTARERAEKQRNGLRVGPYEEYTFLTPDERAEMNAASAERKAELNSRVQRGRDELATQRQRVSPQNPFGAPLDERTGLPEYPRSTHALEKKLTSVIADYDAAVDALGSRFVELDDEFEEAFAIEDRRRATRERIAGTATPKVIQDHNKRTSRIG